MNAKKQTYAGNGSNVKALTKPKPKFQIDGTCRYTLFNSDSQNLHNTI